MIKFRVLALTPVVPYGRRAHVVSRGDPERLFHLLEAKILLADPSCDSADFRVRFIVDGLTTQGTRNVICAAIHIAGGVILLRPTLARRSEERRVGTAGGSTWRSRWAPWLLKKKK